jgi:hypothetical protein
VITVEGQCWGTAAEIAEALGPDVTPTMVRNWARRDGLPKARSEDDDGRPEVRYPLAQAAVIEARKRLATRGRPRKLDADMITAA